MLVVPVRLRRLRCRPPLPKTPLPKSAEDYLQEIARVPPHFRVGVIVILRRDAAAVITIPIHPPNDRRSQALTPSRSVVVGIKWRRIPFARMRRESPMRRQGSAPLHPSHSSSSVTVAVAAVAAIAAVAAVAVAVAVATAVRWQRWR